MLRTYAPLETMDSARQPRGICGSGRRDLQMDRWARRGPLFGSARPRCAKDLHGKSVSRRVVGRGAERDCAGVGKRGQCGEAGIQHHCCLIAERRAIIFRGRTDQRGAGPRAQPQTGRYHHLAPERQRTRGSRDGRDPNLAAAPGSWHLRRRRDSHGSAVRTITEHAQRDVLRAATLRLIAAAQDTVASYLRLPDARFGR